MPMILKFETLTREAFAPFGDVVEAVDSVHHFTINAGNTERYHDLAHLAVDDKGHLIASILRGQPRELPFTIQEMERHPKASQLFMPLSGRAYLVVVAARDAQPAVKDLQAFLCSSNQGVNYAPGVWHHPLLALDKASDFLVVDRAGPGENCDVVQLSEAAIIPVLD